MKTAFNKQRQWLWAVICVYIAVIILWVIMFSLNKNWPEMTIIVIVLAAIAIGYSFYKKHALAYDEERFNEELTKKERHQEELEEARHEKELKQVKLETAYIDKEMEKVKSPPPEKKSELEEHQEKQEIKAAKKIKKEEIWIESEMAILEQAEGKEEEIEKKRDQRVNEFEAEVLREYGAEDEGQLPPDGIERLNKGRQKIRDRYLQILGRLP